MHPVYSYDSQLLEFLNRYFKLLRIFATVRLYYPTDRDLINIVIINTTTDKLSTFSTKMKTIIGRYFVKNVKLHPNNIISMTLRDPRYHQHSIEEVTMRNERQQQLEQNIQKITIQTHEALKEMRQRRCLPDYYLTDTQEVMTFAHYTKLMDEFNQMKSYYKHRKHHSILKPSYIRKHYLGRKNEDFVDFRIFT